VIGMAPFGSAQASWVGERFGPSFAIGLGGAICLMAAVTVSWRMGFFRPPPPPNEEVSATGSAV